MAKPFGRPARPSPPPATMTSSDAPTGVTVDLDSPDHSTEPMLPHERDESNGMTGGAPSAVVQQGSRDLKRGIVDTSRAPEAEAAYRKQK